MNVLVHVPKSHLYLPPSSPPTHTHRVYKGISWWHIPTYVTILKSMHLYEGIDNINSTNCFQETCTTITIQEHKNVITYCIVLYFIVWCLYETGVHLQHNGSNLTKLITLHGVKKHIYSYFAKHLPYWNNCRQICWNQNDLH